MTERTETLRRSELRGIEPAVIKVATFSEYQAAAFSSGKRDLDNSLCGDNLPPL